MRVSIARALPFLTLLACDAELDVGRVARGVTVAFPNPGFEDGFTGWTQVEPAAISSVERSGRRSAKLGMSGRIERTVKGLAPSTRYRLTAWVNGTARLAVRGHGGADAQATVSGDDWTRGEVVFTTGPAADGATIEAAWAGGGDARVDDFALDAEAAVAPEPAASRLAVAAVDASTSDANVAAGAVDGDLTTRWSGYGDGAWLRVDLGGVAMVTHVMVAVHQGDSRRNRFDLQVSMDGASWATVWSGESGGETAALERIEIADTPARWVRYVGHGYTSATGDKAWSSVTELEAHGWRDAGSPFPGPAKLPAAGGVTASTSDENVAEGAVDGDLATRWSGYGDGAWLRLDLGGVMTVSHVLVAVHQGDARRNRFEIQVSSDGTTWRTVWSGESSGASVEPELVELADTPARWVRYVGHGYVSDTASKLWSSVTEIEVHGWGGEAWPEPEPEPEPPPGCSTPAELLDLASWKLTLPVGESESPAEIEQPALASFALDPWFVPTAACDGVRFRAHTSGVTTSGSGYPRSELREMTGAGGASKASWSTTSGTHRMFIDQAITAVPRGKRHVVAGQIHDADDDVIVIRLEGTKLFVDIGGSDGPTLDASYTLGERFTVEFVASGGQIRVFYDGGSSPAYTLEKRASGCYFKAGAYTQSNCGTEDDAGESCGVENYGEVVIHDLRISHD